MYQHGILHRDIMSRQSPVPLIVTMACNVKDRVEPPPEIMVHRDGCAEKADLWALGFTLVE